MIIRSVGIIGYGSFGKLIHTLLKRFAPRIHVRIHSLHQRTDKRIFFSLQDACDVDVVALAVPIHAFKDVLTSVLPYIREHTVIVDIATVKVHTTQVLKRLAHGHRYIAMHPMWGPESYKKRGGDVSGFRIVVCAHTLKTEYAQIKKVLKRLGFDVVEMSAAKHDKHLAETLFLTHLVGQVISRGKFNRTEIDTVSFGSLMDAVESVRHDVKLFKDVYHFNPYCKEVMARFAVAEAKTLRDLQR